MLTAIKTKIFSIVITKICISTHTINCNNTTGVLYDTVGMVKDNKIQQHKYFV